MLNKELIRILEKKNNIFLKLKSFMLLNSNNQLTKLKVQIKVPQIKTKYLI